MSFKLYTSEIIVKLCYINDFTGCEIMRSCMASRYKQYPRIAPLICNCTLAFSQGSRV